MTAVADPVRSTMADDFPLGIPMIVRRGIEVHGESEVVTWTGAGVVSSTFAEVGQRAARLVGALRSLGVGVGSGARVATFLWNHRAHQEAYLAVPGMGAVLHTVNIRLAPDDVTYVMNHAGDGVVLVDGSLLETFAPIAPTIEGLRHVIVVGDGDLSLVPGALRYEELLDGHDADFAWPDVDERSPSAMCYTSGTTGHPKGVVYSHRSTYLHSLGVSSGNAIGLSERDRNLPIVPMFHANAWGMPYACWNVGADLLLPDRFLQAEHLVPFIEAARPTIIGGVPTILNDLVRHAEATGADLSSVRLAQCGGSAVPRTLVERLAELGIELVQGWGMTETSPVAAIARPPRRSAPEDAIAWQTKTGRVLPGVEVRVVGDDGAVAPRDGCTEGEIQVRGPWVIDRYHDDPAGDRFDGGWLRTGDVGVVDGRGFVAITDRAKDVIKSGGEWISSIALEDALLRHPAVLEAAVIGVPDARWDERPLACLVLAEAVSSAELATSIAPLVARWWIPERWCVLDAIPRTGVGKIDKRALRAAFGDGRLPVVAEL